MIPKYRRYKVNISDEKCRERYKCDIKNTSDHHAAQLDSSALSQAMQKSCKFSGLTHGKNMMLNIT